MEQDKNVPELEETSELESVAVEVDLAKKKRREVIFEMVLFFVLGVLLGVTIKTEAVKRITIGFNDYQITKPAQSYNIEDLKKKLDDEIVKQQAEQQAAQQQLPTQQQGDQNQPQQ